MSAISELIRYIDGKKPGFEEQALGGDADELAEIERLAGRPLPSVYREYLATMGAFSAGFFPRDFSLDMYDVRTSLATDVHDYPERYVKIGFDCAGGENPMDLFLDYGSGRGQAEPVVVAFNDAGIFSPAGVFPWSWTLLDFLFEGAFAQYGVSRLEHSDVRTFSERRDNGHGGSAFSRVREILQRLGFGVVFDTPHLYAGERDKDSALLRSPPFREYISLEISVAKKQKFMHLGSILDDHFSEY